MRTPAKLFSSLRGRSCFSLRLPFIEQPHVADKSMSYQAGERSSLNVALFLGHGCGLE